MHHLPSFLQEKRAHKDTCELPAKKVNITMLLMTDQPVGWRTHKLDAGTQSYFRLQRESRSPEHRDNITVHVLSKRISPVQNHNQDCLSLAMTTDLESVEARHASLQTTEQMPSNTITRRCAKTGRSTSQLHGEASASVCGTERV